METTIVVLFAVVVLAMLALIWLLRLFFKNYQHRSEGAAFRDVADSILHDQAVQRHDLAD